MSHEMQNLEKTAFMDIAINASKRKASALSEDEHMMK
jgi:hypothetical protein